MSTVVFTNGCFDILHPGHIDLLNRARELGTRLIVGLNSDASVRAIKGDDRPFMDQNDRRSMLLGLRSVDEVIVFDELTPEKLISEIKPDVLVKGGDWKTDEIVGADFVTANGGRVVSLPLKNGYSSSGVVERFRGHSEPARSNGNGIIAKTLRETIGVIEKVIQEQSAAIESCGRLICSVVGRGRKVLVCGNGGSAADAQHIAAELVGRFESERRALPAIALTTDTSALTAISNDYDFERVFSRQVEALANEGDCLIAISTSGNSPNIIAAAMAARKVGCKVVGMTGAGGKKLAGVSDACLMVPSTRTSHVQEAHITVAHIWCEMVDQSLAAE